MIIILGQYDCISLWQPWLWAILSAGKSVENRTWATHKRGVILLHASKTRDDLPSAVRFLNQVHGVKVPVAELVFGAIVGAVNLTSCHYSADKSPDGWGYPNRFHWRFEDVTPLPYPIACRGHQGFFRVEITRDDLR